MASAQIRGPAGGVMCDVNVDNFHLCRLATVETQGGGNAAEPLGLDRGGFDAPEPASVI